MIPQSDGTVITEGGVGYTVNVEAGRDGVLLHHHTTAVQDTNGGGGKRRYGRKFSSPRAVTGVKLWAATNTGYINSTAAMVTIRLFASNTDPRTNGWVGDLIGSIPTFQNVLNENLKETLGNPNTAAYLYAWVELDLQGATNTAFLGEVEFYAAGGEPEPEPEPEPMPSLCQTIAVTLGGVVAGLYASIDGGQTIVPVNVAGIQLEHRRELWVMAGQSNSSGRGVTGELPSFDNAGYMYSNAGGFVTATSPVDSNSGQVDAVSSDSNAGASAALSFIDRATERFPSKEFGVIPCAKGGTALTAWQRNLSRSSLYGSMLARMQEAANFGAVKGVIFYQGEAETSEDDTAAANSWAADFLQMAEDLTDDFGDPDLRFIVTELGPNPSPPTRPNWSTVQAQQQSLDGELDGRVSVVSAADLSVLSGDPIHLDTDGQVALGIRYADAL